MDLPKTLIPNLNTNGMKTGEKVEAVLEYVLSMEKNIRFALNNLDEENLGESLSKTLKSTAEASEKNSEQLMQVMQRDNKGADGISCTHSWNGTVLTVSSASGTSSADLQGPKGDKGDTGSRGPQGDTGAAGADGDDGVSPSVSVTAITGGHRVTIVDAAGTKSFDVMDGEDGKDGESGSTVTSDNIATALKKSWTGSTVPNDIPNGITYVGGSGSEATGFPSTYCTCLAVKSDNARCFQIAVHKETSEMWVRSSVDANTWRNWRRISYPGKGSYTVTLSSSEWTKQSNGTYTQNASISGITSASKAIVDINMSSATTSTYAALSEAWAMIGRAYTGSNVITFVCYEGAPETNLSVNVEVL